jgi:hypothetical protein
MELYKNMTFVGRIKSDLATHPNVQLRNYVLMMCKITADFYELYPVKATRWMDFEVIVPLRNLLGMKITVEILENQDIKVLKNKTL